MEYASDVSAYHTELIMTDLETPKQATENMLSKDKSWWRDFKDLSVRFPKRKQYKYFTSALHCKIPSVKTLWFWFSTWRVWMRSAELQSRRECCIINSAAGRAVVEIWFTVGGCPVAVTTQKCSSHASLPFLCSQAHMCTWMCVACFVCMFILCVRVCVHVCPVNQWWKMSWVFFLISWQRKYDSNGRH